MRLKKITSSILTAGLAVAVLPAASQVALAAPADDASDVAVVEQGEEQSIDTPQSDDELSAIPDNLASQVPEGSVLDLPTALPALNGWGDIAGGRGYFVDGIPKSGWFKVGNVWYLANEKGVLLQNQWFLSRGIWYYLGMDGALATGWNLIDGSWYYLNADGAMQKGWHNVSGRWYFLEPSGRMATGWRATGGAWYYLNASGAMATGWQQIEGKWYYLQPNGAMWTGWAYLGGSWYYLQVSGAMQTGWAYLGGSWYYMNSSGRMHTGWIQLGGNWYYLKPSSGAMATGSLMIDGRNNLFNSNGAWTGYGASALYSVEDLMFRGVINWNGYKFTYYSQRVLPGSGLRIPGRHVNAGGFVADGSGYIVLAAAYGIGHGRVFDTPFGYQGKVYDTCGNCSANWLDVYTR